MHRRMGFACCISAATLVGCDAGTRAASEPSVRDSASITIVENVAPVWGDGPGWRLSPEPILSIGVSEGREEYQFFRVAGVVRLDDGRIAVGEASTNRLRLFDTEGLHLWSAGGTGEGPGELTQVGGLLRIGRDTLALSDYNGGVNFFSLEGQYVGSFQFPRETSPYPRLSGVLQEGSLVFLGDVLFDGRVIDEPTDFHTPIFLSNLRKGETEQIANPRTTVLYPSPATLSSPTMEIFGPPFSVVSVSDGFYASYPDVYELRKSSASGVVTRIVRRPWTPTAVTSELFEEYLARSIQREGEEGERYERLWAQRRRRYESSPVAANLPAFTALLADKSGNVWVREADPEHFFPARGERWPIFSIPSRWSVFDPDGTWLGAVEMPANVHVFEIGDDYVAGVSHDDLDVERVVVYDLIKGAAGGPSVQ